MAERPDVPVRQRARGVGPRGRRVVTRACRGLLRGDRPPERRAERLRDALRGARARGGGRDRAGRRPPARRRADRDQGPGPAHRGRAHHLGHGSAWRSGSRRSDSALVRRLREAGAIIVGKTNTPELGILPVTEPDALRPRPQPVGHLAHAGRLLRRQRRGRRVGHGPDRARQRRRRLDPHPGFVLRARGAEAQPRARLARARWRSSSAASGSTAASAAPSPTPRSCSTSSPATSPATPTGRPHRPRPFADAARRAPGALRIAFTTESPHRRAGARGLCRGCAGDGGAARVARALGLEAPTLSDEGYIDNFIRVWTAGVAISVRGIGTLRGQPLDIDLLEPLTREMMDLADTFTAADYLESVGTCR